MSSLLAATPLWRTPLPRVAPAPNALVRGAQLLFVASIPFEMPDRAIPLEVPTLTGVILLAASLLNPAACYRRVPPAMVAFFVYLWALVATMLAAGVVHHGLAMRLVVNMTIVVLVSLVMVNALQDRRLLRATLIAFVGACALRAAMQLGVATEAHAVWTGGTRVTTLGQNANLSAIILSAGMVAAVGLARSRLDPPWWIRRGAIPLGVLFGAALIQTGSRGGLICAVAGLACYAFERGTIASRARRVVLVGGGLTALGVGAWQSVMMRHRLEESAAEGRLAGREVIYPAVAAMIAERPMLGWGGIENQYEIARRIRERDLPRRDAHNLVLELLSASGLMGALPFLAGMGLAGTAAFRARQGDAGLMPLAVLVATLMGTVSGTWIASKILWLALTFAIAAPRDGDAFAMGAR
jgi:O-antigen ligase